MYYLRNKEKQEEIDFLIVRDGLPWLPVEVKLSDVTPSKNWSKFLPLIGCKFALQVVNKSYWKVHKFEDFNVLVADAAEILHILLNYQLCRFNSSVRRCLKKTATMGAFKASY